ncbi:lysoplasmalogenase [Phenylobacterium sp. J367]|uniref:lysoplasmalogenase n=1 Tax=Phenylobacterium sp. J367 TaxID=2898435 RepID=UPI0021508D23|nr:lysoplasmalogenase [Phenylobacterium sp. J367]MCR5880268.1 lysoplasmalogenase [Phenylobacterium sp. J367]
MNRDRLASFALAASLLGGISYIASWNLGLPQASSLAWKGTGVGFLAVYAALKARSLDGWLIAAVMALGALGDVLLDAEDMTLGGVTFLAGHLVAVALYLRNRRPNPGLAAVAFAVALVPLSAWAAYVMPTERAGAAGYAIYAGGVALMAAAAWLSRFPRHWVGLGALAFVVSDLLIFARIGPLAGQAWVSFAVWGLYFGGQALICTGVVRALQRGDSAA